jgi:hypothetical protein
LLKNIVPMSWRQSLRNISKNISAFVPKIKIDMPDLNLKGLFPRSSVDALKSLRSLAAVSGDGAVKKLLKKVATQANFPFNPKNVMSNLSATVQSQLKKLTKKLDNAFPGKATRKADLGHGLGDADVPLDKLEEGASVFGRNPNLKKAGLAVGLTIGGCAVYAEIKGISFEDALMGLLEAGLESFIEIIEVIGLKNRQIGEEDGGEGDQDEEEVEQLEEEEEEELLLLDGADDEDDCSFWTSPLFIAILGIFALFLSLVGVFVL